MIECVSITVDSERAAELEEALTAAGLPVTSWQTVDSSETHFRLYAAGGGEAKAWAEALQSIVKALMPDNRPCVEITSLEEEDWRETWKRFFHIRRVSERIIVAPDWEADSVTPGGNDIIIRINPGQGFGTGQHPTTHACLHFMDQLAQQAPAVSLLDAGCGSGILAITAVRLGFSNVTAFDNDPAAVQDVIRQAELNNIPVTLSKKETSCAQNAILLRKAELNNAVFAEPFQVVAANLLAELLIEHAGQIRKWTAPEGHLLIAGILQTQYTKVLEIFQSQGFSEIDSITEGEWKSGHLISR